MTKRINIPKRPHNDSAYRKAFRLLSRVHKFRFGFRPKNPFTSHQKAAITKAWKKYAYLILYADATTEWRNYDKAGDPRKGKAFPQYFVTIHKVKDKKIFKDIKKGIAHSNKGFIFVRDDATKFEYFKREIETVDEWDDKKIESRYVMTWMHRPKTAMTKKTPWRMFSEIIPIPVFIFTHWDRFVPWLRDLKNEYPNDAQFSLIFGKTNFIIKPLDFDKIEFYATNEMERLEERLEEYGKAKFPYSAIRVVWYEQVKI